MNNTLMTIEKTFLPSKVFFARTKSVANDFFASVENAAETAAIILISVALFVVMSYLTLKFIELFVFIVKQTFFFPPLFELRKTDINLAGLADSIVLISFLSGF